MVIWDEMPCCLVEVPHILKDHCAFAFTVKQLKTARSDPESDSIKSSKMTSSTA
jgi:hypothetical protein